MLLRLFLQNLSRRQSTAAAARSSRIFTTRVTVDLALASVYVRVAAHALHSYVHALRRKHFGRKRCRMATSSLIARTCTLLHA
jgi:hypothetical protein